MSEAQIHKPRWQVLAAAVALSVGILCLRAAVEDPNEPVFMLAIIPIAMVALEYGRNAALIAATLAVVFTIAWFEMDETELSALGYGVRFAAFYLVGGGLGHFSTTLRRQNALLGGITSVTPDVIFIKDSHGRYQLINPAGVEAFGQKDAAAILGRTDEELLPPEIASEFHRAETAAREAQHPINTEVRVAQRDGEEDRVFSAAIGELQTDEHRGSMFAVARDVTAEKSYERELARAAKHFEISQDMLATVDFEGHLSNLNKRWEEVLGWTAEEICSMSREERIHPDDLASASEAVAQARSGPLARYVNRYRTKDGDWKWVTWNTTVDEEAGQIYVAGRDITAERAAQAALRRAARHFEISMDMMCTTSKDGEFLEVNSRWEAILGWTEEELIGRPFIELVHPEDVAATIEVAAQANVGDVGSFTNRYQAKTGEWKWLQWSSVVDPDSERVYAVARDVTEEKETDKMKTEFFALVSHELRTPLTSIIGYLELILEDEPEGLRREFLEICERNSKRLVRLVGDLLYAARLEAGREVLVDRKPMELVGVAREAIAAASPVARASEIELRLHEGAESLHMKGDTGRIGQAIDNLISNALKFTPPGGRIDVWVGELAGEPAIRVSDTGPGISKADQERLFDRFFRTSSAHSQQVPGVGLGLSIVRSIATQHDGRVEVSSEPGEGTTFTLMLQKRALPAAPAAATENLQPPSARE